MIHLKQFTIYLVLFLLIFSCSQKNSLLTNTVQNNPASLVVVNNNGFIGSVTVGTTRDFVILISSIGGLSADDIQTSLTTTSPIEYKGGVFPGTGGTCGTRLDSGESCNIILSFTPTSIEIHSALLSLTYKDAIKTYRLNFNISADSRPILTFEYGSQYDFGNKFLGSTTDLRIKISNTGVVSALGLSIGQLSAPFSFKGGSYPGTGGSCGSGLIPGQVCEVIITYTPTTRGQHLQDINLNYTNNGVAESNTLNLLAWGFSQAQLTITSPTGDDFGTVATNNLNTKTYVVTHVGGDVSASSLSLNNLSTPFSRVGGTCTNILTIVQGSCTIILGLNSSTSASWNNTFNFSYNGGTTVVSLNKTVTAITKARPILSFSLTSAMDFGTAKLNTTISITFTVNYISGEIPATNLTFTGLSAPFSRTGGTCTTTLTSGSCTIIVSFTPTIHAVWTQPVVLSYEDAVTTISSSGLSVTGKAEASILPTTLTRDFGNAVAGQTKNLTSRISFLGGATATNITVLSMTGPFHFTSGAYPGSTTNSVRCTTVLASGFCDLYLTFAPLVEGNYDGNSLVIRYDNGVNQTTFTITLNGVGSPAANLTVQDKSYSSTPMNSAVAGPSLLTITNNSSMPATSIAATLPMGFSYRGGTYPGTSGTCGVTISGSGSCTLDIVFAPLSAISYSGSLSVSYNDGVTTQTRTSTLTGTGTTSSDIYISNFDSFRFATTYVGKTPYESKVFTLGHGGGSTPSTINTISLSNSDFSITNNTCPSSLNNGATCTITVAFNSVSAGAKSATLDVDYVTGGVTKSAGRSLLGTANAPTIISVSPAPVVFGSLPTNVVYEQELTLTKSGSFASSALTGTLSGSGFTFKGGSYPGTGGTCPTTGIFPASCKVVITFTPVSVVSYNGTFSLNYNNGFQTNQATASLSGSGLPTAQLVFSSSSYNFGQVIQTLTSERTLTLTNSGTASASSLSFSSLSAPYHFKGGSFPGTGGTCSTTLAVSANCFLVIEFAPTATGISTQTTTVSYNNAYSSVQSSSNITGEGLAQAIISISETNPYNFGTTNSGGTIDKLFTLTNAGSVSGTGLSGSFSSVFNYQGGSFPGASGNCLTTLAPGSSCNIVLSFSPAAAVTYTGSFTLNYHDGLRIQSELKNLQGTGSAKLDELNYLAKDLPNTLNLTDINHFQSTTNKTTAIEIDDINDNGFLDLIETYYSLSKESRLVIKSRDGLDDDLIYKLYNLLPQNYSQGFSVVKLDKDFNFDGLNDLLLGIYIKDKENLKLVGFDIICQRTGNILIRNLGPLQNNK